MFGLLRDTQGLQNVQGSPEIPRSGFRAQDVRFVWGWGGGIL